MNLARIVQRPPPSSTASFWYVLEAIDGPYRPGAPLRHAFARRRPNPDGALETEVDSDEHVAALERLKAWANGNGWTVEA